MDCLALEQPWGKFLQHKTSVKVHIFEKKDGIHYQLIARLYENRTEYIIIQLLGIMIQGHRSINDLGKLQLT